MLLVFQYRLSFSSNTGSPIANYHSTPFAPDLPSFTNEVCLARALEIESKIQSLGVGLTSRCYTIACDAGDGLVIFQGMQDSTAESIKSLEGFDVAWVQEAPDAERSQSVIIAPYYPKGRIGIVGELEPTAEEGRH